jgi:hypothetical protein
MIEPERSGFFLQSGQESLGILRDVYNRLDVLKTRGRLTLVDPYTSLLIIIIKNALPIGTNWLYLLYNLKTKRLWKPELKN